MRHDQIVEAVLVVDDEADPASILPAVSNVALWVDRVLVVDVSTNVEISASTAWLGARLEKVDRVRARGKDWATAVRVGADRLGEHHAVVVASVSDPWLMRSSVDIVEAVRIVSHVEAEVAVVVCSGSTWDQARAGWLARRRRIKLDGLATVWRPAAFAEWLLTGGVRWSRWRVETLREPSPLVRALAGVATVGRSDPEPVYQIEEFRYRGRRSVR